MRYALGTFPVLLAWPTLLLPNQVALASQFVAFAATWFLDMRATNAGCVFRFARPSRCADGFGWVPRWYSTVRVVVGDLADDASTAGL